MSDKRLNALNDYEQLKRRNRRRLIGASVMVVIAGALFIKAFSSGGSDTQNQQIDIQTASDIPVLQTASETVTAASEASVQIAASDVADAAVLEPASDEASAVPDTLPEAPEQTPLATQPVEPAVAVKPSVPPAVTPKPEPKTTVVKKDTKELIKKAAKEKEPLQAAKPVAKPTPQTDSKPTHTETADHAVNKPKDTVKKEIVAPKTTTQTVKKPSPKDILEGRAAATAPSAGKVLIQAGAYSSADQAKRAQQTLANAGVSAYITEANTSKGKVYRVRSAAYPNREAANHALEKIRAHGLDGIVIGQ